LDLHRPSVASPNSVASTLAEMKRRLGTDLRLTGQGEEEGDL
jgi:hypothetical protein